MERSGVQKALTMSDYLVRRNSRKKAKVIDEWHKLPDEVLESFDKTIFARGDHPIFT
jgi:hypothetical protein